MPKINEIFDIKPDSKHPLQEEPKAKPKKKREFTEEQKQVLRDRLKLGREKAAANREAKKETEKEPTQVKLENKVAAAMDVSVTDKEVKVVTKYLLELDEGDDMDPKELKAFIKTLYKASKSNIVREAQAAAQTPKKSEPKQEARHDDTLFTGDEEIPRKPTYQVSKPVEQPKPVPPCWPQQTRAGSDKPCLSSLGSRPHPGCPSKEEQMRIAALAKVKAAIAAKKRR